MFAHLLSLSIWIPIVAGVVVLASGSEKNRSIALWLALLGALAGFAVTLPLFTHFDRLNGGLQFRELHAWIPALRLNYDLGVDGISVLFVILNSFTTLLVVMAGWKVIQKRTSQYMAAFLIMSGLINGAFCAADAILFYVFFEGMLIPMYLIIGIWGGPRRVYASIKFFLYTLLGSLLMLVGLIYLSTLTGGSFSISDMQSIAKIPLRIQEILFVAFFLSFAVKVPMWPVHTWLPDAHGEAPTGGSMVLAAITLKIGAYGFLRFAMPILPDAARHFAPLMIALSLVAVVYIGLVALVQTDMKKLVAYSSISHMGFVTLGLFLFATVAGTQLASQNAWAVKGAILQMISHGFVSAAMFMCIGVMYDRMHTRNIADYGGVVTKMPVFASFMMLFAMANAGLPATSGFVGEFMVVMGAIQVDFWVATLAATTLIFGAAYTLWMYKRVIFGPVVNPEVAHLEDVNKRELLILVILAIAVLGMGLFPKPFISIVHQAANNLIAHVAQSKL